VDSRKLFVLFDKSVVGNLICHTDDYWEFSYNSKWKKQKQSFPISQSLPLLGDSYKDRRVRFFFANLLPEGNFRSLIAKRLSVPDNDDYQLLCHLGKDCAGALSIVSKPGGQDKPRYTKLRGRDLNQLFFNSTGLAEAIVKGNIRISLAGAQDKLPVLFKKNKSIYLPKNGAPSSHIMKLPNPAFLRLPENEAFVMGLAQAVGLNTAHTFIMDFEDYSPKDIEESLDTSHDKRRICVVQRYDRIVTDKGITRIHQEDFCQAFGFNHLGKYESDGGPSFKDCYELVISASQNPTRDARQLISWLAFNYFVGNTDAHAKNLSLIYDKGDVVSLAPFYDLISTKVYSSHSREMAMKIGDHYLLHEIDRDDWKKLAELIKVKESLVLDELDNMANKLKDNILSVSEKFIEKEAPEKIGNVINSQAKRVQTKNRSSGCNPQPSLHSR
jgi:serine/threonine-protein kinase HipA